MITKWLHKKYNVIVALCVTSIISLVSGLCIFAFIPGIYTGHYVWYGVSATSLLLYCYIKTDSYQLNDRLERLQHWADKREAKAKLKGLENKVGSKLTFSWSVLFLSIVSSSIAAIIFSPVFLLTDSTSGGSDEELLMNGLFNLCVKVGSFIGILMAVFFVPLIFFSKPTATTPSWMKKTVKLPD
ncbi:hypothetical protein DC915_RS02260 [Vibrio parahaemolyticus]|nr:hypothetical protein [Vibrio parahaemolyticus]EJG0009799.1 hypothetical protein [Vibrio parahaemolyticus]ELA8176634.1 hypothetical protein [Vibrio alginolyticus]